MNVIVDFCLVPLGTGVSLSPYVAACERILQDAGLKTALHANGTNIEGEWDTVFAAIKRCHEVVHEMGAPRIFTVIKLGTRTDRQQTMESKVDSVLKKMETPPPSTRQASGSPPQASVSAKKTIEQESDLDTVRPAAKLLDAVQFQHRVRGRLADDLKEHGTSSISNSNNLSAFGFEDGGALIFGLVSFAGHDTLPIVRRVPDTSCWQKHLGP